MGITKKELKDIVKECLIEILSEGMGTTTSRAISESKRKSLSTSHTSNIIKQNASKTRLQQTHALKEAIKREAGGNDIMASILADTAEKTLPTMLENDRMKAPIAGGKIENIVASHAPEEIFGEDTTSKWADLAFMGIPKK